MLIFSTFTKKDMIQILNRELTDHEFFRMKDGFDEHSLDNGVIVQEVDRFTFVAEEKDIFVVFNSFKRRLCQHFFCMILYEDPAEPARHEHMAQM